MFTQEDLSVTLKCFAQAVTNCLLSSAERTKRAISCILIAITLEENIFLPFFEHFNPIFFFELFELFLLISLIIAFQELQNFNSGFPHLPYVLVCVRYTFTCQ